MSGFNRYFRDSNTAPGAGDLRPAVARVGQYPNSRPGVSSSLESEESYNLADVLAARVTHALGSNLVGTFSQKVARLFSGGS